MFELLWGKRTPLEELILLHRLKAGGASVIKTVKAALVHITDALAKPLLKCEVTFEPIQDLHGQDAPYPAGGGKNIFDGEVENGNINNSGQNDGTAQTYLRTVNYIPVSPSSQYTISGANQTSYTQFYTLEYDENKTFINNTRVSRGMGKVTITTTATTKFVRMFWYDAPSVTTPIGNVQFEAGSIATDYSPYENLCPITGWTGVDMVRAGKNLVSGIVEYGSIDSSGKIINTSNWQAPYDMVYGYVIEGETYTISTDDTSGLVGGYYSDVPTMGATSDSGTRIVQANKTFTATKTEYIAFRRNHGYPTPQLEVGSSASEFEAYQGTTIPITFPALGKNLVDPSTKTQSSANIFEWYVTEGFLAKGGVTYTLSSDAGVNAAVYVRYLDGTAIVGGHATETFTLTEDTRVYFRMYKPSGAESVSIQLEEGSSATSYEPYTSTVYGSTLTINEDGSGTLAVDTISASLTGSAITDCWYAPDSDRTSVGFYHSKLNWQSDTGLPSPLDSVTLFDYCKTGNVYNNNNVWNANFLFVSGSFNRFEIRIPKSELADISTAVNTTNSGKNYLNEHPLQAVYHIEPITYTLTNQQVITLLKGENNIWSTANGDIEITYKAKKSNS